MLSGCHVRLRLFFWPGPSLSLPTTAALWQDTVSLVAVILFLAKLPSTVCSKVSI